MAYPKGKPRIASRKHQDEFRYIRYIPYLRQKAQAAFRGEPWFLTFEQFCQLWPDEKWQLRGRTKGCMCMVMQTYSAGWHIDNVEVLPRSQAISYIRAVITEKKNGKQKKHSIHS